MQPQEQLDCQCSRRSSWIMIADAAAGDHVQQQPQKQLDH
jgi:hypothetical protein